MPSKVLILESLGADYGAYFLTRGFTKLLGADNVRSWPYKNTNEGNKDHYPERIIDGQYLQVQRGKVVYGPHLSNNELWAHPAFWRFWKVEKNLPGAPIPSDGPVSHTEPLGVPFASDDEIFSMVAANEFDLIVLNGARWHGAAALHELQQTFGKRLPPLALCDHDDYTEVRWDFINQFKPSIYFKRSRLNGASDTSIRPFPFSSMWDLRFVPWVDRDIDVFCVFGATQAMRRRFREVTEEVTSQFPGCRAMTAIGHPMQHPEYLQTLRRAKIVIDQQSFGTDTLRFWEASAAGCCLLSDFDLHTPPPHITPDVHYLKYDNDRSPSGDQQNFVRFRELLAYAITHDAETQEIAHHNYALVRTHHTNQARAQYVIDQMRTRGHSLPRLP